MRKLILHVGMPKCGSSSIQQTLSDESFSKCNPDMSYCAIYKDGVVVRGRDLFARAVGSPFGYVSSHDVRHFEDASAEWVAQVKKQLSKELESKDVILSCEGWGFNADKIDALSEAFKIENVSVEVLICVRPQCDWVNSAWWQWGVWGSTKFDRWVENQILKPDWLAVARSWDRLAWVSEVNVLPVNSSFMSNFFEIVGACIPKDAKGSANVSSPRDLLALLFNNRELRSGPHDAVTEFCLLRNVQFDKSGAPWVMSESMVSRVIGIHRESNMELEGYVVDVAKKHYVADVRYFSYAPYAGKGFDDPECLSEDPMLYRQLCVRFAETIKKMDIDNRVLRKRLWQSSSSDQC